MRQVLLTALALSSLVLAATAAPVAAQDGGLAPDGVQVHIDISGDGDARWTIAARYDVNETADRDAFDDVAGQFERGQGELGFTVRTFERVVPQVADRTGREMAVEDPQWSSVVRNESGGQTGYLRLSFTWTNFAAVDNETVRLDDVFAGGWFGDLGPDQTLVVQPPPGFDVSSAQPSHETVNGTLRWSGPVAFGPNEPVATFERQPLSPGVPWMNIAGAVVTALVIGGIIAYAWFWRNSHDSPILTETGTADEGAGSSDGGADAPVDSTGGEAGPVTDATAAGAADGAADTDEDAAEAEAESATEPELLSDEERVERLLEERGGRMKQARIVEETRWSNAKVSQLLSQMAADGRVEKLRIGRENLISLPSEDDDGTL